MDTKIIIAFKVLLGIIIFFIINYFLLLPMNPRYGGTVLTILVFAGGIVVLTSSKLREVLGRDGFISTVDAQGRERYVPSDETRIFLKRVVMTVLGIILGFIFIYYVISSPILNANKYYNIIEDDLVAHTYDVTTDNNPDYQTDFKNVVTGAPADNTEISTNDLAVVDKDYAAKLANGEMGEHPGLGSQFSVGSFTDIMFDYNDDGITTPDEQYLIAPLEYNGFWKWWNNKNTGAPGYILVDKNTQEVELIEANRDGSPFNMKYLTSSYFSQNVQRRAYFQGAMNYEHYGYYFEIDDDGNPYWVIPVTKPTIMVNGGDDVFKLVLVDAQTGDVDVYNDLSTVPAWVDNIYPVGLVTQQINYRGKYKDGFFNSVFAKKDLVETTEGTRDVADADGNLQHFTGLSAVSSDKGTTGFVYVDTRTKEIDYYQMSGYTEYYIKSVARTEKQNYNFITSFPIPVKVNNVHTYFMTYKGSTGIIAGYAFVDVKTASVIGTGDTVDDAYNAYLSALNASDQYGASALTVDRIYHAGSITYVVFEGSSTIYEIPNTDKPEILLTKEGDSITFTDADGDGYFDCDADGDGYPDEHKLKNTDGWDNVLIG